jgi:hypothetical protein
MVQPTGFRAAGRLVRRGWRHLPAPEVLVQGLHHVAVLQRAPHARQRVAALKTRQRYEGGQPRQGTEFTLFNMQGTLVGKRYWTWAVQCCTAYSNYTWNNEAGWPLFLIVTWNTEVGWP